MDMLNDSKTKKKRKPVNFIIVSIILAVIFWIVEGFIHGLLFNQPDLLREIIIPEAHELWMRVIVVTIMILSGVFVHIFLRRYASLSNEFNISERKYSELFKKATVAITIVDTNGRVVDCNRSTELLTGYRQEELIGKPFNELLTLDAQDLPILQEKLELLARGREVAPYELRITRKDGEHRWIDVANSLLIQGGVVQGIQVMATDITAMKTAEMVRRKFEDEKDLVLSATRHLIIYYNKESEIIWANRAALETMEKDLEDVVGRRCQVVWLHSEEMCADCPVKKTLETNETKFGERKKPDSSWWSISGFPVRSDSGDIIGVVEVTRDITDQKKAAQDIKTSEIRLRTAMDSLPFDFFMIDKRGHYVMQNVSCQEKWGDIVGKRPADIADNEETRRLWEENNRRAFAGETVHGEVSFTLQNKRLHCYNIITPIWEQGQVQNIIGVNIDITDLKEAEEALQHRLAFEKVLATISTRFINIATSDIDGGIEHALEGLGKYLKVDRSYVFQLNDDRTRFSNTHEWCEYNIPSQKADLQDMSLDVYPWAISQLKDGKTVLVKRIEDLPKEADGLREVLLSGDIKSMITVPIYLGGVVMGFVGCDAVRKERTWSDDTESMLITVSGMFANALERKQVDIALRQSEVLFRQFFENEPEYCYMVSPDGMILNVNNAALKALGYKKDELVHKPIDTIYAPEAKDKIKQVFKEWKKTGQVRDKELVIVTKAGEKRTVLLSADMVKKLDGTISHSISVQRDITDRKKAEEDFRMEKEFTDNAINAQIDTFFVFNPNTGKAVRWNVNFRRISGYSDEEIGRMKAPDSYYDKKDLQRAVEAATNVMKTGSATVEMSLITKSGKKVPFEYRASLIKGRNQESLIISIGRDITERKKAEEALRESEERFEGFFEQSQIGMGIYDENGSLLNINPACLDIFGIPSKSEVKGFELFKDPNITKERIAKLKAGNIIRYEAIFDFELVKKRNLYKTNKSGMIWTNVVITPVLKEGLKKPIGYVGQVYDVTERKRAEEALLESEEKYRDMTNLLPEGVYEIDINGKFVYANEKALELAGYSRKDLDKGVNAMDVFIPDDRKRVRTNMERILKGKDIGPQEYTALRKDGSSYPVLIHSTAILRDGKTIGLRGIMVDITERKYAEKALKESEDKYRSLFELAPEAMVLLALDGTILDCNSIAAQLANRSREELIGNNLKDGDLIPSENIKDYWKLFKKIEQGEETGPFEIAVKVPSRGTVLYEVHPSIQYKDDRVYAVQVMLRDITAAKELENVLKNSATQWTTTFDAIGDAVCMLDAKGEVIRCNASMLHLCDKSYRDIIGKKCCMSIHNRRKPRKDCPLSKMKKKKTRVTETIQTDTGRWLSSTADPIFDENKKLTGTVLIVSDITEQKRLESELLKAQKLESLGILAGGIAHDFNNILLSIMGNIEISKIYTEGKSDINDRLSKAYDGLVRAKDLVQQLLTFSKGGAPIKKATSITDVIKDTTRFVLRGTKANCEFDIAGNIWPVEVDEGQISQVINNIIINAEQAMPEGGKIEIHVKNTDISADNTLAVPKGEYVKISIRDHGIGIPEEHITKIFDPYFTTKDKGSGLGLATSYSIIKKHNGYIFADSKKGKGTTFTIYLQASKDIPLPAEAKSEKQNMGQGRILVMDDEAEIREIASEMLGHCGYDVMVARDGDEAFQLYTKEKKTGRPFDVVILDLTVRGGMGGMKVMELLKKADRKVKVIVSSGYANDPLMAQYKKHGFKGAIGKPYRMKELCDVIARVMKKAD
ncbi:MAG: PAS domain S-box protein [candidate division WOR-3 bacterium]|nr:MAG: PAS domain S-box protein [candidate division WOR-3 bacterium]